MSVRERNICADVTRCAGGLSSGNFNGAGGRVVFTIAVFADTPLLSRAMKAKVIVLPKQNILDPQGVAVRDAIRHHGVGAVASVRVGKFIELELSGPVEETALHEICRDLLSNPVVEDYVLEVEG